jgi:cytochrome P450
MPDAATLHVVEALLVIAIAAWGARPLLSGEMARRFPRVFWSAAGLVVAIAIAALLAATYAPAILHLMTVVAVALTGAAAWFGRVGYGRSRGLPPGSLSLEASIEALLDRSFYRNRAAGLGPVFKMLQFYQPTVCVVGLDRAHTLLRTYENALGPSVQGFNRAIPQGFLRYMSIETHGVYGPMFRRALSPRVVSHHAAAMGLAARRVLGHAARSADRAGGVLPDPYLDEMIDEAFLAVLFGLSADDPDLPRLKSAYAPIGRLPISSRPTPAVLAALAGVRQLLTARCARWRALPDAEVPLCALSEFAKIDAGLPDDTCLDNLVFIYRISTMNVAGLLRWVLAHLGGHPDWISRLRAELDAQPSSGVPALADRIVMETLRLSQAEYLYRRLRDDIGFEGFVLPKGWLVRLCIWESHRASGNVPVPDRFDPDRFLRDQPRTVYMPFGGDRHACNGVALSNVICRVFLEELTRSYAWSVDGADPVERQFRHWSHWRPSRRMRLRLAPRRDTFSAAGLPATSGA